jgi:phospholipid-translocating ATPase
MMDGIYQSVIVFFVPYLLFYQGDSGTFSGLSVADRVRFGAYFAHPAVLTINGYVLINTYRWDWLMLLIVSLSDIFVFVWTGIYTSFTSSDYFYGTAAAVYGEASFWACFFLVPIMCLFPRYAIKSIQKVYFPYDVDIIREQERLGHFRYLDDSQATAGQTPMGNGKESKSSGSSSNAKHQTYGSVDEDLRPIYPPSIATRTTHNQRSQNGSDSTTFTGNRLSTEQPLPPMRPSMDRVRPSYDRMRASMDRVRPSFEASNDFTSAARLSRIESNHATQRGFKSRLRGLSLSKNHHH